MNQVYWHHRTIDLRASVAAHSNAFHDYAGALPTRGELVRTDAPARRWRRVKGRSGPLRVGKSPRRTRSAPFLGANAGALDPYVALPPVRLLVPWKRII